MAVVDGMHRLTAATLRGEQSIMAVFFEGTDADAFVEAVRLNVKHGKPLTLSDREEAAKRILSTHPHWSDRRIAEVCGMSPKTIARLRRALAADDPDLRIGRDGRVRPVDATQGRLQAAAIIERHPAASIREVAELAGTSSGTVRDVRRRLTQGRHPVPDRARENRESGRGATSRARHDWSKDAALRASDRGEVFVEWLDRTRIASDDWQAFVDTLPLSRLYLISEESRRRSDEWARFASQLEDRARKNE
jgi:DNA-binding CsgD family transcriptional regulator